jgi:hypothetical protein
MGFFFLNFIIFFSQLSSYFFYWLVKFFLGQLSQLGHVKIIFTWFNLKLELFKKLG